MTEFRIKGLEQILYLSSILDLYIRRWSTSNILRPGGITTNIIHGLVDLEN
ncbi:hypothetical protein [Anaerococcus nagyae]|uniref:hypothetical protein n=1 Tax=Anaerococcus nagyae TaxID=1755241 RepID=UPI001AE5D107|nr:hypothetical protein [Anaerococcus nagyae]MBP2070397.1 hypothetical protein [Anaerococcus nagyae]